jgi:hypothetical protein
VHGPFRRQARKCWKKKHALVVGVCDNENNNIFIGWCHWQDDVSSQFQARGPFNHCLADLMGALRIEAFSNFLVSQSGIFADNVADTSLRLALTESFYLMG